MAQEVETQDTRDIGWITFAGIMLMVAGMSRIFDGIWALRYDDTVADLAFFEDNIEIWGVFWIALGVALFAAGWAIFNRAQWARWLGLVAAAVSVPMSLSWAYVNPGAAIIAATLGILVIWALAVHAEP
jgi:hypothetical protein